MEASPGRLVFAEGKHPVPLLTILIGGLLVVLTFTLPHESPTAYIPAALGGIFVVLGLLAFRAGWRKHVMHLAAALGLIGLIAALSRAIPGAIRHQPGTDLPPALISTSIMAALCAVFVALCVSSFIAARRRQAQRRAEERIGS
jgi:membrane associated rhomboid family serine protease